MSVEHLNLTTGGVGNDGADDALANIPVAVEYLHGITVEGKAAHRGAYNRILGQNNKA